MLGTVMFDADRRAGAELAGAKYPTRPGLHATQRLQDVSLMTALLLVPRRSCPTSNPLSLTRSALSGSMINHT